ncbi:MAG: fibronectin type III domain-containing protein [Bacteroidota bacterium]|nr:fibronectin type III domain-containing protein [Bacteroidota bacterium]
MNQNYALFSRHLNTLILILSIGMLSAKLTAQTPTPPDAPMPGMVTAGDGLVTIIFAPPMNNGGSEITSYAVTSNPGNITVSGTTTSLTITGLTNGTPYTFTITATNTIGTSNPSFSTPPITPGAINSIWTGAKDNNWSEAANWTNGVPGIPTNVFIPIGFVMINQPAYASNITVAPMASVTAIAPLQTNQLTLQSNVGSMASFINNCFAPVNASIEYYLTGNNWHIISPAVSLPINSFLQNSANEIPLKNGKYGMMDYNETSNSWNNYFTSSTSNFFEWGKGYGIRRTSDGTVTFTGFLTPSFFEIPLTKTGTEGWNCIGNPLTSAIDVNSETSSFLAFNASSLDPAYACIYLWDEQPGYTGGRNDYTVISKAPTGFTQDFVAPGQGFFVKAASNNAKIQFMPQMQFHQNMIRLKATRAPWPAIRLRMAGEGDTASTIIAFNNTMTKGLDPSYDAGLLRGTKTVNLYSRLVNDNGKDFALQCLPETYDSLVIPLGLDCKAGGKITFSAETAQLPADCKIILEDRTSGSFTSLSNGASYSTTVEAGTSGIGRFYLHTAEAIAANNNASTNLTAATGNETLRVYAVHKTIHITGNHLNGSIARLYDTSGRNLGSVKLTSDNAQTIDKNNIPTGVCIVRIASPGGNEQTFKVILME